MTCLLYNDGTWGDEFGSPCAPSQSEVNSAYGVGAGVNNNTRIPQTVFNQGNTVIYPDKLSQVLATITSMAALVQHAPYVPTTGQPAQPQVVYQANNPNGINTSANSNALGKVQAWITKNSGVSLMLAAGAVLFFMKTPAKRNGISVRRNGVKRRGRRARRR